MLDKIPNFKLDFTTELAWIFHDIIYLPFNLVNNNPKHTNEKLSARFLDFFLVSNYPEFYHKHINEIEAAQKMILGTEQHVPFDKSSSVMFDVDMSYLGYSFEEN